MPYKNVRVRFAPSPTGSLHLGSARTAYFNYLFAKHYNGQFLLRVEDTDQQRSTPAATEMILTSLKWLGLGYDESIVYQQQNLKRHQQVVQELLESKKAYRCYCTTEEIDAMREQARQNGKTAVYNGHCRKGDVHEIDKCKPHVVRLLTPDDDQTVLQDLVQGEIKVQNSQIDDYVIQRSDGTPTYMLAVVVDDHDMLISHVIRGDDHLTNTFRQLQLYAALNWQAPDFAHIPLIHGQDGAKLSKRHGATSTLAYQDLGILPEALKNYLLRLGWSHGDAEIIPEHQAIEWFNLKSVGKAPARFDMDKLINLNAHYIRCCDDQKLLNLILPILQNQLNIPVSSTQKERILQGMPGLKERAKTILELAENAQLYCLVPELDENAKEFLIQENLLLLDVAAKCLQEASLMETEALKEIFKAAAKANDIKLGKLMGPLRVALTGRTAAPSLFDIIPILGKEETLLRIQSLKEKISF